jgi:2-polyprenyl-3-methyl-5-hydroxy-6-metoxy-1,4-benzoquinol methylase
MRRVQTLPNGAYKWAPTGKLVRSHMNLFTEFTTKQDSILDIGCCSGIYVKWLRDQGYDAHGLDAIPNIEKHSNGLISYYDLSLSPSKLTHELAQDWGFCLEVGEHIPADAEEHLFRNLTVLARNHLVISWADRFARGYGHVNCHHIAYVAMRLAEHGWQLDEDRTYALVGKVRSKYKVLVFEK